jgi:hypothetical protein
MEVTEKEMDEPGGEFEILNKFKFQRGKSKPDGPCHIQEIKKLPQMRQL